MSRMTKFLKQTCTLEKPKRNKDGSVKLNKFGEIMYELPMSIKCRREEFVKDVVTNTGAILRSSTRYFVDEAYTVQADDRLDGKPVLQVESYVNAFGRIEGFESYV